MKSSRKVDAKALVYVLSCPVLLCALTGDPRVLRVPVHVEAVLGGRLGRPGHRPVSAGRHPEQTMSLVKILLRNCKQRHFSLQADTPCNVPLT